jgi:hypothetical protein
MKRYALILAAACGLFLTSGTVSAWDGCCCGYSGYQPCWNLYGRCKYNKCKTAEELRLEHFWHDYYDALRRYYKCLDRIDWVAYYKNHGYQINAGCGGPCGPNGGCPHINYAPVFVSPCMQWAVPGSCLNGPPVGGPGCGY